MKVIIDIETNSLSNPDKIWVIVAKDIATNKLYYFRNPIEDSKVKDDFLKFAKNVDLFVGHNFLDYDYPVCNNLLGLVVDNVPDRCIDTLIISKLVNYSRVNGHSVEAYGEDFQVSKLDNSSKGFFSQWSQQLEDYCVRDVDITHLIYNKYLPIINNPKWKPSIVLEHRFQMVVNKLHVNGFAFNTANATTLLEQVTQELAVIDAEIANVFQSRIELVKEIHPKRTRYGTLNKSDFRWYKNPDLSAFSSGPLYLCSSRPFNPGSHKQVIDVLHQAGWSPYDKTSTHIGVERELNRAKTSRNRLNKLDLNTFSDKLEHLKVYGWKINENNLSTLPPSAPAPAHFLARRILLESRRRTLVEWTSLATSNGRIHGKFIGIGAWTHRMAHQKPNTANIPNEYNNNGSKKLLGKEMRALWIAPKKRLLVGVDAEGIQLRIFAHYINDKEFTEALVNGRKEDKTDPHSLNQRILGFCCKSRAAAKRLIYALLLGASIGKLSEILESSREDTEEALSRLIKRYSGFDYVKRKVIPYDAKRGYFEGLDGREVVLPGDTARDREHLCMSGYLQNGEQIIMKKATLKWEDKLNDHNSMLVNLVHDEWQMECPNKQSIALHLAREASESLRIVGEELGLKCPLAGSYWNDDNKKYTIGTNWSQTH